MRGLRVVVGLALGALLMGCSSASTSSSVPGTGPVPTAAGQSFAIQVWADNWMAVYVNGVKVGEDSVPITTERSFNAETFTFAANYPFTLGIEARDYMASESGIEYIGQSNQQRGDGGLIAQVTDRFTGKVVAATDSQMSSLVIQRAPLNADCEKAADPNTACKSERIPPPAAWSSTAFDDSTWSPATTWTADRVKPKEGYDQISWDSSAALVWGTDLLVDNIVLFRKVVSG